MLSSASFRLHMASSNDCPIATATGAEHYARSLTGIKWIATGERKVDSLERRGMLGANAGLDVKRRRAYPLSDWSNAAVWGHMRAHNIPVPPEYSGLHRSFGELSDEAITYIAGRWPDDYAKIRRRFPFVEASRVKSEFSAHQASEVRDAAGAPQSDHGSRLQPASH